MLKIRRTDGFTLIELLVVIAILGILGATSIPLYRTWQHRAYGSEAAIMVKQILDAEILYYLDNDEFYPEGYGVKEVLHGYSSGHANVNDIYNNLNIKIPTGHFLDYTLESWSDNGIDKFSITISSLYNQFDIFKNATSITGVMDKDGNTTFITPY